MRYLYYRCEIDVTMSAVCNKNLLKSVCLNVVSTGAAAFAGGRKMCTVDHHVLGDPHSSTYDVRKPKLFLRITRAPTEYRFRCVVYVYHSRVIQFYVFWLSIIFNIIKYYLQSAHVDVWEYSHKIGHLLSDSTIKTSHAPCAYY